MEKISDYSKIMQTLSEIYFSSFYVDVKNDEYVAMRLTPWMSEFVKESGVYSELVDILLHRTIIEEYYAMLTTHLSLNNIRMVLGKTTFSSDKHSFYLDYQAVYDYRKYWVRVTVLIVDRAEDGTPEHVLILLQDITSDKEEATKDSLTGVYNRVYGEKMINAMITSDEFKEGLFVIVDIDNFKQVNDRLGHQMGDSTLVFLANYFMRKLPQNAVVCRIGGDEFIIFLKVEDMEKAKDDLDELRKGMQIRLCGKKRFTNISGSFGVAEVPKYGTCFEDLYSKADAALYESKEKGRNRITWYIPEMQECFSEIKAD